MEPTPTWVRALGIDHGDARIGLAISDDLGFLAHPLETVSNKNTETAITRIVQIVEDRKIEDLVVGLPLRMDGSEGDAVKKVRAFSARLRSRLPESVRFHEMDETYTTVTAYQKMRESGRKAKQAKPVIDQAAAVEILQAWLDGRG